MPNKVITLVTLFFCTLHAGAFAQQSVPLEIPNYSYESLYDQNKRLNAIQTEIEELNLQISQIEDSRPAKKTKLWFLKIPCCGKEKLNEEKSLKLNQLNSNKSKVAASFSRELAEYRESLRSELSVEELASLYSKDRKNLSERYLNLIPNSEDLLRLEKQKELVLSKTLELPADSDLDKYNYLKFEPITLPKGVMLSVKGSSDTDSDALIFRDNLLSEYNGDVGPIIGDKIEIKIIYPKGVSKKEIIYIEDVLISWEGTKYIDEEITYGPEQSGLGPEASGFDCGSSDSRQPEQSQNYPSVLRMGYNNKGICSAFLLKENIVVTAGHCISDIIRGNRFRNTPPLADDNYSKVFLETYVEESDWQNGRITPSKNSDRFKIVDGTVKCGNCTYKAKVGRKEIPTWNEADKFALGDDWAFFEIKMYRPSLKLNEYKNKHNIPDLTISNVDLSNASRLSGTVMGYGIDLDVNQEVRNRTLQSHFGTIDFVPQTLSPTAKPILTYNIHTQEGSSGSPIFLTENGKIKEVVGVHTHGFCTDKTDKSIPINVGTPINSITFN